MSRADEHLFPPLPGQPREAARAQEANRGVSEIQRRGLAPTGWTRIKTFGASVSDFAATSGGQPPVSYMVDATGRVWFRGQITIWGPTAVPPGFNQNQVIFSLPIFGPPAGTWGSNVQAYSVETLPLHMMANSAATTTTGTILEVQPYNTGTGLTDFRLISSGGNPATTNQQRFALSTVTYLPMLPGQSFDLG